MKSPFKLLLPAAFAFPLLAHAQSKNDKPTLQPPAGAIVVDGKLNDWGDSLRYLNEEKKIPYTIANDKDNIYIALRISDHTEQRRALMAGITFSIDPKGKKKESFSVTFPYTDPEAMPAERMQAPPTDEQPPQPGSEDDKKERMQAMLTRVKQIKATGFPDVLNEVMTTANTYGIKTALNFDSEGFLVYEAAVPISMLHVDKPEENEWAFNIKINGFTRPKQGDRPEGGRGDRGGMDGGMGGGPGGGGKGGGMGGGVAVWAAVAAEVVVCVAPPVAKAAAIEANSVNRWIFGRSFIWWGSRGGIRFFYASLGEAMVYVQPVDVTFLWQQRKVTKRNCRLRPVLCKAVLLQCQWLPNRPMPVF